MRARWYVTDLSIQFWQRIDDVLRIMQNVSVGKSSGSTLYQPYYLKAYSPQHSLPTLGTLENISLACEMDLRP